MIALCEVKTDAETVKREFDSVGEPAGNAGTSALAAAFSGSKPPPKKYHKYWNCCTTKKGYSGTALFSKVQPIAVTNGIGIAEVAAGQCSAGGSGLKGNSWGQPLKNKRADFVEIRVLCAPLAFARPPLFPRQHDDEGRTITAEYETHYLVLTYVPNAGQKLERLAYRTTQWGTSHFFASDLPSTALASHRVASCRIPRPRFVPAGVEAGSAGSDTSADATAVLAFGAFLFRSRPPRVPAGAAEAQAGHLDGRHQRLPPGP